MKKAKFMLKKFRQALGGWIDVPLKDDPKETKAFVETVEEAIKKEQKSLYEKVPDDPTFTYQGSLDELGREIPDPRVIVEDVKPLTQDQKILNQFIKMHNRAAIEKENLPWKMDTKEDVQKAVKEAFDLDMPEEEAEFISQYEVMPMAQDWPDLAHFKSAVEPPAVDTSLKPNPVEQPATRS